MKALRIWIPWVSFGSLMISYVLLILFLVVGIFLGTRIAKFVSVVVLFMAFESILFSLFIFSPRESEEESIIIESLPERAAFRLWSSKRTGYRLAIALIAPIILCGTCLPSLFNSVTWPGFYIGIPALLLFVMNVIWIFWSRLKYREIKAKQRLSVQC